MKLITKKIEKIVPQIGTNSNGKLEELNFYVKLFTPWSDWTWYIAEMDFKTGKCFGLVCGFEKEVGYFDLNELIEIKGPFGMKIERDLHYTVKKYSEVMT